MKISSQKKGISVEKRLRLHYQKATGNTPVGAPAQTRLLLTTYADITPPEEEISKKLESLAYSEAYLPAFVKKEKESGSSGLHDSTVFFLICYWLRHHRNVLFERWPLDKKPLFVIATLMGVSTERYWS